MLDLKTHQQEALNNVNEIFEKENKAIVVQPTGIGKTYIALGLFEQNKDKKLVFVAPSTSILWEIKLKIAKEYGVAPEEYMKVFENLELTTYQQINANVKKDENFTQEFDADYVVFDEAHHIGADQWGENAKELMKLHPKTKFLGLTATPERTDEKNVVNEVFDGNLASEITLEDAVATGLLKMPNYVNAIYSYKPVIEELEEKIKSVEKIDFERYKMLKGEMEVARKTLEKADGMPEIFEKHMQVKNGRYIVFCKDIEHLNKMVEQSKEKEWFGKVNENVETLEIHSGEDDDTNSRVLKRFKTSHEATENSLKVLFAVEKINEGVHIDNLDGVMMLRPTKSKIMFRQQLGRAMSINSKAKDTVVFDIVNNIDSFQEIHDFMENVIQIRIKNSPNVDPNEIRKNVVEEFNISDETREIKEILRKVTGGLESEWEMLYQRSVKWREEHEGNAPKSSKKDENERNLYGWENYQKLKYLKEYQDKEEKDIPVEYREKVRKLKKLGLVYKQTNYRPLEERFEEWKSWTIEKRSNTKSAFKK